MNLKNNSIDEIVKLILSSNDIVISGHTSPDGDSVGSTTALCHTLKIAGKSPKLFMEEINERYNDIPFNEFLIKEDIKEVETLILMDCADEGRLPKDIKSLMLKAKNTINIDHHISNNYFAKYNYVIHNSSSTSEIAYDFIKKIAVINEKVAISLYAGIVYDTGGFKHNSTKSTTHAIASELMKFNINANEIYFNILSKRSIKEIKALQLVINKMEFCHNNKINYTYITFDEFKKLDLHKNDLGGIVDFLCNVEGVDVSFFAYSKDGKEYKFSLRSKVTDVNQIASRFGGGGHINASGCKIKGNIYEIVNKLLPEIIEVMDNE